MRWKAICRVALALAGISLAALAQPARDPLRAVHDALFAALIPVQEMESKPEFQRLFLQTRDGIWSAAGQAPAFRGLIAPFSDLRTLGPACGVADVLKTARGSAFDQ